MENIKFKTTKNGEEIEYEVLSILKSEDATKKFICYTDNVLENDERRLFVSKYEENGDDLKIFPLDDNEWKWFIEHFKSKNERGND